jgi:chromosome partitioning protein
VSKDPAAKPRPASPTPPSPGARVIAISNQKGGEGKTTTAVNLAASLAAAEKRVLLIDLDPQGNASSAVGQSRGHIKAGSYELLLGGVDLKSVVQPTELPTLQVVPASEDLAGAEIELVSAMSRETVLARALKKAAPLPWDYVILDCPPSLGLLTLNALVAADSVLIPMQAKYFSLEGLGALTGTIGMVKDSLNPRLVVEGIVFCMLDKRTNLAQQVVAEVKAHFAEHVFETVIPPNVRLSESPSHGKPVLLYDIESKGAKAYLELAQELLARAEARRTQ